jgi:streptogramin lyase
VPAGWGVLLICGWGIHDALSKVGTRVGTGAAFDRMMILFLRSFALALLVSASAHAGGWSITTIAGTGTAGGTGDGGSGTAAQIDNPFGLVRGPDGALWFCEYTGQRIRRLAADGTISTIAGTGAKGYSGDGGPALQATFNLPHELRFDAAGDLFVVDMTNHAVRKIALKTGIITTIAGSGKPGYSGDGGPAVHATFKQPHSIQFGPDGSLYVCDIGNNVIRRIDMSTGLISTFAGTGKPGPTPDGSKISGTPLKGPRSLDFDQAGNLWLCTREGNQVLKFDLKADKITVAAGTGAKGFTGHGGPAREATLSGPKGIAIDAEGNVWLADCESHSIRMIDAKSGKLELMAGTGAKGNGAETDPLKCAMARPHGVFCEKDGSVLIGDSESHKIRRLVKVAGGE